MGALPGAVIGADVGLGIGTALLEYLGLAFLAGSIGRSLWRAGRLAGDAVRRAWESPEHRDRALFEIDRAARELADAVALLFRGVLEGVVAFLLAEGSTMAASRVPALADKLRASRLGAAFAEWVERNWVRLVEEPRLKAPRPAQPSAAVEENTGSAMTPSQLRRAAAGASGTVRAVIGQSLRPGNVWETSEMPALMANPNVTRIISIDPSTKVETTIFVR